MKRFAILRDVPPDMSWEQVDAAAIQNMISMGLSEDDRHIAWEPSVLGVSWVRSYWEPGSSWGTCLYTAPDGETVKRWHDLCQVPYVSIREIEVEEDPEIEDKYPRGFHETRDGAPLVAVEAADPGSPALEDGYRLIRKYRYPDSREELQLFLPTGPERPPAPTLPGIVRRVVEIRPGDYD